MSDCLQEDFLSFLVGKQQRGEKQLGGLSSPSTDARKNPVCLSFVWMLGIVLRQTSQLTMGPFDAFSDLTVGQRSAAAVPERCASIHGVI